MGGCFDALESNENRLETKVLQSLQFKLETVQKTMFRLCVAMKQNCSKSKVGIRHAACIGALFKYLHRT